MPTLKQEFIYFNDAVGRTLPNAKLYAYESGTTTPKNTYTDKSLANANPHPVVADAAGRFPVIWLASGGYRIVIEDENGVEIHDRDDINTADEQLNATSSIYFKTLADLKLLIAQNGSNVDPQIGDALRTLGEVSSSDDKGAEWVVVAGGTGTADDDTYVDLDNGLQAERVFNQLYRKNNGSDIENKGTFRTNLDVYSKVGTYSTQLIASPSATSYDLSGEDPGFYLLSAAGDDGVVYWDGAIGTTNVFNIVANETADTANFQIATVDASGIARRYSVLLNLPSGSVTINADDTISEVYKVGV